MIRRRSLLCSLLLVLISCVSASAYAALAFYETTKDPSIVAKAPESYEKVDPPPGASSGPTYVTRRNPKLRINENAIEAVVIEERRSSLTEEEKKQQTTGGATGKPYYAVTFVLRDDSARQLRDFLAKRDRERLGIRLGKTTIGVIVVVGPFEGREFTMYVEPMERHRVEAMFGSVKDKVRWK